MFSCCRTFHLVPFQATHLTLSAVLYSKFAFFSSAGEWQSIAMIDQRRPMASSVHSLPQWAPFPLPTTACHRNNNHRPFASPFCSGARAINIWLLFFTFTQQSSLFLVLSFSLQIAAWACIVNVRYYRTIHIRSSFPLQQPTNCPFVHSPYSSHWQLWLLRLLAHFTTCINISIRRPWMVEKECWGYNSGDKLKSACLRLGGTITNNNSIKMRNIGKKGQTEAEEMVVFWTVILKHNRRSESWLLAWDEHWPSPVMGGKCSLVPKNILLLFFG